MPLRSPKERFLFADQGRAYAVDVFTAGQEAHLPTCSHRSPSMPRSHPTADGLHTRPEGAGTGIYVQPFPATGAKYLVSKSSATSPAWSRDGREIVSQPQGGQQAVQTITTQPSFSFSPPVLMPRGYTNFGATSQRNYDVMPDGRILGVVAAGQAQSAGPTTPQIPVVLHWFEELMQRVPSTK